MHRRIAALAIPIFLLGIAAAPVPKTNEESTLYFPTKVGDKWTYTLTEKTGKDKGKQHELVEEVTAVEDKQGVKIVTVGRLHHDAKVYWNRERHVSKDGVWDARDALSNEPILVASVCLKLPHKPDQQWDERDWTRTACGPERVNVPAGEFAAIRVVVRKRGEPKADPEQTEWFAPGVGIIKLETPRVTIEMKSLTPGK
jgi:hypothetical protein